MINESIEELLEQYVELTKLTTICLESSERDTPLLNKGININLLKEYTEYNEVVNFLKTEINPFSENDDNSFHTFFTKSNFVYNIVRLRNSNGKTMELITGPMLNYIPNSKTITMLLKRIHILPSQRQKLINIISTIPVTSDEGIRQRGSLLVTLVKIKILGLAAPTQSIYGRKALFLNNNSKDPEDSYPPYDITEYMDLYKFYTKLMYLITLGDIPKVTELIGEGSCLFYKLADSSNNRLLKNRCIITCGMACHNTIGVSAPNSKIIYILTKSKYTIEHSSLADEIIEAMNQALISFTHVAADSSDNHYSLYTKQALHYIKTHFEEQISLTALADYVHVNPVYLSKLINKETGMSLSTHINSVRIEESKFLLIHTKKSLQDIAITVGFSYQNHFNTIFKKLVGSTPFEFRQSYISNKFC